MNRLGRLKFSFELIREQRKEVAAMFANYGILPLDIQHSFYCQTSTYIAYSAWFDEVPEWSILPEYTITTRVDDFGDIDYSIEKRPTNANYNRMD